MAKVRKLPQDRNSRHLPAPPFVGLIPETNLQKPSQVWRAQYRRDFLSRQFAQRENLYAEFINEAARLMADSLEQEMVKPGALVPIYGLENRIRLNASDEVVQAARSAIQQIVESYRRPRMTEEDIRRGAYLEIQDPVKEFGEACRKELSRLYRAAA